MLILLALAQYLFSWDKDYWSITRQHFHSTYLELT